jgi:DMSO/TMAO reductase YedYZ molybdopterin-dependent catalytic subunit
MINKIKSLLGLSKEGKEMEELQNDEPATGDIIISPDTLRENRIPPGQHKTTQWPVLHAGMTPEVDVKTWKFRMFGLVEEEWYCNYEEFLKLPKVRVKSDFHCVTTWSRLDNLWEGVSTRELASRIKIKPEAKYVLVHAENRWTTNMPLEDFLAEDCLFAYKHDGKRLSADHGYPVRLVIPRLYAWKSAKWAHSVEFLAEDKAGYWERGGYHMKGDPWTEERYRWS